jgi:hypothetical protein
MSVAGKCVAKLLEFSDGCDTLLVYVAHVGRSQRLIEGVKPKLPAPGALRDLPTVQWLEFCVRYKV